MENKTITVLVLLTLPLLLNLTIVVVRHVTQRWFPGHLPQEPFWRVSLRGLLFIVLLTGGAGAYGISRQRTAAAEAEASLREIWTKSASQVQARTFDREYLDELIAAIQRVGAIETVEAALGPPRRSQSDQFTWECAADANSRFELTLASSKHGALSYRYQSGPTSGGSGSSSCDWGRNYLRQVWVPMALAGFASLYLFVLARTIRMARSAPARAPGQNSRKISRRLRRQGTGTL